MWYMDVQGCEVLCVVEVATGVCVWLGVWGGGFSCTFRGKVGLALGLVRPVHHQVTETAEAGRDLI